MHLDEIFKMTHPTQGELKTIGNIWERAVPTTTEKAASVLLNPSRKTGGDGTTYPTFTPTKVLPSLKVHGKTVKTVVIDSKRYAVPDDIGLRDSVTNGTSTKIDTGIYASDNIEYFVRTKCNTTGSYYIFQARQGTNGTIYGISGSQTNATFSAHGVIIPGLSRTVGHIYAINLKIQNGAVTFTVIDETAGITKSATGTTSNLVSPTTIGLFGAGNYLDSGEQVYEAWIKKDGALVWYMHPAVKNGSVGAWNPVNDTFTLPTGTLTAGKNTKTVKSGKYTVIDGEYYDGTGVIRQASGYWRLASMVTVETDTDMSISCGNTSDDTAHIGTDGGDIEPCIDGYDIVGRAGGWWISGPNSAKDLKIYQYDEAIFDFANDTAKSVEVPLYELYGVGEKLVPDEYDEVEYISNPTKLGYLDTDYKPNNKSKFECTYEFEEEDDEFVSIFGCEDNATAPRVYWLISATEYRVQIGGGNNGTGTQATTYSGINWNGTSSNVNGDISSSPVKATCIADYKNNSWSFIQANRSAHGSFNKNTSAFQCVYPLTLFVRARGGAAPEANYFADRIYSMKIWDDDVLVRNFRPVKKKSNNEYGMYDLVSKQFFGNASGTGAFTGGPVVSNWSVDVNVGKQAETPTKHSIVLNSQLHGNGDSADTGDVQTGEVKRKYRIKVLDGTESYTWGNPSVSLSWSGIETLVTGVAPICSHFEGSTSIANDKIIVYDSTHFRLRKEGWTGVQDAKDYIAAQKAAGHPVVLIYAIVTEIAETATPDPVSLTDKAQYTVENTNLVKGDVQATVLSK